MRTTYLVAIAFALTAGMAGGQEPSSQVFQERADVGQVSQPGTATALSDGWRISASGANIWGSADAMHYVFARRSGDLHVAADIAFEGRGVDPHRKAGVMIRQNLTPGSPYADVMVHGDGMVALQFRAEQDGPTRQVIAAERHPTRVRLEREGDFVYFSIAGRDGVLRHAGGSFRIAFQAPYLVGVALSAHNDTVVESATFRKITLDVPTLAYVPDTGYAAKVESTLEVMEIDSVQSRQVVRHFPGKIEAPNWTPDDKWLVYNADGRIWRIPKEGGEPEAIETGPHIRNNNDHGISPDGRQLVISDQSQPDNFSRIYLLPLSGSKAPHEMVSDASARSYWHGWSPEGKTLAYVKVGANDGSYDIWAKDIAGGSTRPLVVGPGVDDGPEWSPDGKHLWFNSTRSGAMQIWRAGADGADPVQVTRDPNRRDWFPHLSPDGKWVAYVSFGLDIAVTDHPPNREDVALMLMPADLSAPPRVLTRLFGGQGTMNVPSWSPDSKQIAFVSYRLVR